MISLLCRFLRPFCVICTLLMMFLLITTFWGAEFVPGEALMRLLFSYVVLMLGSLVVFYIDDPQALVRRKKRDKDAA